MSMNLADFVKDFAAAIVAADAKRPVAVNQRSGVAFQPGIGPHTESRTVELPVIELKAESPAKYSSARFGVAYPGGRLAPVL